MSTLAPIVVVDGVTKHFPGHPEALSAVSLAVRPGEAVSVTGPNGSGKSTLFKALLGLTSVSAGAVRLFGLEPVACRRPLAGRIGAVLEGRANVYERLSTYENARYYCGLRGSRFDRKHFDDLCGRLAFRAVDRPIRRLSTGNRQRAALVVALAHRPDLILLDEPTIGLDIHGVQVLQALLDHLRTGHGATLIVTSHDAGFVGATCERAVGLDAGRVVYDRPVAAAAAGGYRLVVELGGQEADAPSVHTVDSGTFHEQLKRLQQMSHGSGIRSARIHEAELGKDHSLEGETGP